MSSHLQISLLGDFRLLRSGEQLVSTSTFRVQALVAYLALHRATPQPRASIAFLFWPDSTEAQALTNLRHLLHALHQLVPTTDAFVRADKRTLSWDTATRVSVDLFEFEESLAKAEAAGRDEDAGGERQALESAAALYQGELLRGCTDEWILPYRDRLQRRCVAALERLVRSLENARDYSAALQRARRWQELEPAHETPYCALMRLHLLGDDRAAALQVYRHGVDVLQRELGVGPGPALRELHDQILGGARPGKTPRGPAAAAANTPELPLHGRHREWQRLRSVWTEAAQGRAQAVMILGEAGIGKSRLAQELCAWVEGHGDAAVARTRSYGAEGRLAFAPVAQWLRTPVLRANLTRLERVWLPDVARLLPELAADRADQPHGPPGSDWQRHRLFEALVRAVLAGTKPVLLLLDDMQWTDPDTLEWLRFLLRSDPRARLLVIGTVRTEELAPDHPLQRLLLDLRRDEQVTEIQLGALSAAEAARIAADVAGSRLAEDEAARLHRETEGNPLFVVETVRAGLRRNHGDDTSRGGPERALPLGGTLLPAKVQAVLETRLAQLSPAAGELAGVAATLGRAFTFELLAGVSGRPENEITQALDELWQRRILHEPAAGLYDFTHDKLRDVAYTRMNAPRRAVLHHRAAGILEHVNAANLDAVWTQIAAHLEAAARPAQALAAYRHAAEAAKRVHANEEAIRLLQKALVVLERLSVSSERTVQELELNAALGVCLVAARGYPDRSVWRVYERALELCRQLRRPTAAPILRALAIASLANGQVRRAHALGEELLAPNDGSRDPVVSVEGHYVLGVASFWLGRFAASRLHLEQALALYDAGQRDAHLSLYAQDPRAICLCRLSWTLWYLGFPSQARASLDAALAAARAIDHPHTHGYVLYFGALACVDMRQERWAAELLDELETLTARHALLYWAGLGRALSCLYRARETADRRKIAEAEEHMARSTDVAGNVVNFSQFFGLKALAYLKCADVDGGRAAIADAFKLLERIDERYYLAELHRLQGELLRAEGAPAAEVAASFQRALNVAREQAAKACELRAAMSLARLWHGHRNERPARRLVEDVCASFEDPAITPDREEARLLFPEKSTRGAKA